MPMRLLVGLCALVLFGCVSAEAPAAEQEPEKDPVVEPVEDAEPEADEPLALSVEHVREACGSWQDYLDIHADISNYFADNLDDTLERQALLKIEMTRAANRSGDGDLAAATAAVVRRDWRHEDTDLLIALCQEAGIPIRSSLPTAEDMEELSQQLDETGSE